MRVNARLRTAPVALLQLGQADHHIACTDRCKLVARLLAKYENETTRELMHPTSIKVARCSHDDLRNCVSSGATLTRPDGTPSLLFPIIRRSRSTMWADTRECERYNSVLKGISKRCQNIGVSLLNGRFILKATMGTALDKTQVKHKTAVNAAQCVIDICRSVTHIPDKPRHDTLPLADGTYHDELLPLADGEPRDTLVHVHAPRFAPGKPITLDCTGVTVKPCMHEDADCADDDVDEQDCIAVDWAKAMSLVLSTCYQTWSSLNDSAQQPTRPSLVHFAGRANMSFMTTFTYNKHMQLIPCDLLDDTVAGIVPTKACGETHVFTLALAACWGGAQLCRAICRPGF